MATIRLSDSEKNTAAVIILLILAALLIYFFFLKPLQNKVGVPSASPGTASASATLSPSGKFSPKPTVSPTTTSTPIASPKTTPVPPTACGNLCEQNKDCGRGGTLTCYPPGPALTKSCRNPSCPSEPDCVCP